jgi:hypothetical protein
MGAGILAGIKQGTVGLVDDWGTAVLDIIGKTPKVIDITMPHDIYIQPKLNKIYM